jgi:hypothetical protein
MGPRIYPSFQDTNTTAKGSLILTKTSASTIEVYVNSIIVNEQFSIINGLYTYGINIGDVVTITTDINKSFNVTRKDYTTDDNNGNNGIVDTFITGVTNVLSYTFTATTSPSSYNFEYLISMTPTPTPTATPLPIKNMTIKCQFDENVTAFFGANATFTKYFTGVFVDVEPYIQQFSPPLSPNEIIFSSGFTSTGVLTMLPNNAIISLVDPTTVVSSNYLLCYTGLTSDSYVDYISTDIEVYVDSVLVESKNLDARARDIVQCGVPDFYYSRFSDSFNNLFGNEMFIKFTENIEIYGPVTAQFAPEVSGKTYTCFSAPSYTFAANSDNLSGMTRVQSSIITTLPNNGFFYLSKGGQIRRYKRQGGENYGFAVDPTEICQTPTPTPTTSPTPTPTPTQTPTPTPTPTPIPQIITTGLTSYLNYTPPSYPGTGTTWTNIGLSGSTYNATLVASPTFTSGSPGFFDFDGTTQYATLAQAASGSTTGSYTLSAWVQVPTGATSEFYITRGELASPPSNYSLRLGKSSSNRFTAEAFTSSGFAIQGTTTLNSSTWYNITLRWISGTGLSLWVNGVKEAETLTSTTSLRTSTSVGWILMKNETTNYAPGKLSSVAMYFRNLSDAEILSNFNTLKSIYGY